MKYQDFIKNKKVILVGPAKTLVGKETGNFIDSHDVVIRTNGSFPVDQSLHTDYGKRCDSLYINMYYSRNGNIPIRAYEVSNLKFISLKYDPNRLSHRFKDSKINFRVITREFISAKRRLRVDPLMGTYIVNEILGMKPASVYITGMSFYSENNISSYYIPNYLPPNANPRELDNARLKHHKQELQNKIFRNWIKSGQVTADKDIHRILKV